jgi:RIO kinase 1
MRIPDALVPLAELGVIDEVVRPLMSGKEAQVFLVSAGGELRVAKVYKESTERSFQNRADYTEGRRTRNTRDQRAMDKRSRFGRDKVEAAWRTAEVDAIYRLTAAGVRVPHPFDYVEGVLVMELISDDSGNPAPRLCDVSFTSDEADAIFSQLIGDVVRMLCAGLVHGDLSDFNVLMGRDGPVLIDFPQAIDPAHNRNARKLLVRDVDNLTRFLGRFAPHLTGRPFGAEMWDLYERGLLKPDSVLTGHFKSSTKKADTWSLLAEIEELERESLARREALGLGPPRKARKPMEVVAEPPCPRRPAPASGP